MIVTVFKLKVIERTNDDIEKRGRDTHLCVCVCMYTRKVEKEHQIKLFSFGFFFLGVLSFIYFFL